MRNSPMKTPWTFCSQYSPETTIFDTYLEERKSQTSSPNTIIHRSPDLKSELFHTMKSLQEEISELKSIKQFQKYEFRKNLLKLLNKEQVSNKNVIKQVIRTILVSGKHDILRKKLLNAIDGSDREKFFLVFNELGQNHPPTALYEYNETGAHKLFGPDLLDDVLTDDSIRFSLKYDSLYNKFKVVKSKSLNDDIDAIILR